MSYYLGSKILYRQILELLQGIRLQGCTHEKLALWSYAYTHQALRNERPFDSEVEHEIALLCKGVLDPDNFMNFPHHSGKDIEIAINLIKARIMFLEDNDECFYFLGQALHYVQDKWTLRPRISDKHTKWEQDIERFALEKRGTELIGSELENKLIEIPNKYAELYKIYSNLMIGGIFLFVADASGYHGQIIFPNSGEKWLLNHRTQNELVVNNFQVFYTLEECLESVKQNKRAFSPIPFELKVLSFANLGHPSTFSTPEIDYNYALLFSQNLTLYALMPQQENNPSSIFMKFAEDRHRWFEVELLKKLDDYLLRLKQAYKQNPEVERTTHNSLEHFLLLISQTNYVSEPRKKRGFLSNLFP